MAEHNRRRFLQALGGTTVLAGCLGGSGGGSTTAGSSFPAGSCLAKMTESVPNPTYGFEFSSGPSPEVGEQDATTSGAVDVADGVATFGKKGGEIRLEGVPAVDDLTVSMFARPAVAAKDQWNVMLWYSPTDRHYAGWGVEHGKGAVDFFAEGPQEESTEVLTKSSSGLAVGNWAHVLGVKRGEKLLLYVDGRQVASSKFPYDVSYGGADSISLVLGRHAGSGVGDRYYSGDLDSVALWDRALSSSEVEKLLSRGSDCR